MSAAWSSGGGIPRVEAIAKIEEMARSKGYTGAFKVFYDGEIIADPSDLPDSVIMAKVKVSAVLDQASV